MENFDNLEGDKSGVKNIKTENNHYVVSIVWKDGEEATMSFPVSGFTVVNPNTKNKIGEIGGVRTP